jgi:glycosyltransferase involved in cell wall biosynthesis
MAVSGESGVRVSSRVTLFINSLRGGGAERVCATLANELYALGWNIQILVLNLRDAIICDSVHPNIRIYNLGVEHARYSVLGIARYVREQRPEQFLVFNHQLAVLLVLLRGIRAGRFSVVARNISTLSRKASLEPSFWHRSVVHALTRAFYRRVELIIAQSEGMKRDLICSYGINEDQLRVIHNPLSESFSRQREGRPLPWQLRGDELLYVGRLSAIKGLDLLIDACAICMRLNPNLVLRLVGDGEEKAALKRRAESAGIGSRVVFEGYVTDAIEFFANAKLLVLTSHYEGFPNVLLEALSQGTPIVSVDCESGPSEIVQEGINGFLVRSREARDFANTVQRALARQWDAGDVQKTARSFSSREIACRYAAELISAHGPEKGSTDIVGGVE